MLCAQAEGWEHWLTSQARWDALGLATKPVMVKHLQSLNDDLNLTSNSDLIDVYAQKIWNKFVEDHLKILSGQASALVPLYSLTENYVKLAGTKLETSGEIQSSLLSSAAKPTEVMLNKQDLKSSLLKRGK